MNIYGNAVRKRARFDKVPLPLGEGAGDRVLLQDDKIDKIRGMDVVICTTAQTDEEARELLTLVGAPFER